MDGSTPRWDADRELSELRERAYGPDPDIGVDPAALARLRELEAANGAGFEGWLESPTSEGPAGNGVPPTVAPADTAPPAGQAISESLGLTAPRVSPPATRSRMRSLWERATATWRRRLVWAAGVLALVAAAVATVILVSAPRPDVTMHPTADVADIQVLRVVAAGAPWLEIDGPILHSYGSFLGLEIWSGANEVGSPCLIAVNRANDTVSEARCTPSPAELRLDVSSIGDDYDGLPGDGIVRFILREDTVDAYVYLMPEAD